MPPNLVSLVRDLQRRKGRRRRGLAVAEGERLQRDAAALLDRAAAIARATGGRSELVADPVAAGAGADAVYADVWTSMGQDAESAARRSAFRAFTVDEALMGQADPGAIFLHCLPAHRGEEVTDAVIDGPASRVWDQAENRLHTSLALLYALISGDLGGAALG